MPHAIFVQMIYSKKCRSASGPIKPSLCLVPVLYGCQCPCLCPWQTMPLHLRCLYMRPRLCLCLRPTSMLMSCRLHVAMPLPKTLKAHVTARPNSLLRLWWLWLSSLSFCFVLFLWLVLIDAYYWRMCIIAIAYYAVLRIDQFLKLLPAQSLSKFYCRYLITILIVITIIVKYVCDYGYASHHY